MSPGRHGRLPVRGPDVYAVQVLQDLHHLLSGGRQPVGQYEILLDELHVTRERRVGRWLFQRKIEQMRVVPVQDDVGTADGAPEQVRHVEDGVVQEASVRPHLIPRVFARGQEIRDFLPELFVRQVDAEHVVVDSVQRRLHFVNRYRFGGHVDGLQRPILQIGNLKTIHRHSCVILENAGRRVLPRSCKD